MDCGTGFFFAGYIDIIFLMAIVVLNYMCQDIFFLKNSLTKEYCSDFERVNKFILCYLNIIDSVSCNNIHIFIQS